MGTPRQPRKHKTHKPELSEREVRFARLLFAGDKTAPECYLQAGFPPRATPTATSQAAHRIVKKRYFRAFLRDLQDAAAEAAKVDAARVVRGLARVAFFDLREVFDDRGRILLPREWPEAVAAGVLAVKSEEMFERVETEDPETGKKRRRKELVGYAREVKRAAPTEALRLLAQILRLIGTDADAAKAPPDPLVVGGEADPGKL